MLTDHELVRQWAVDYWAWCEAEPNKAEGVSLYQYIRRYCVKHYQWLNRRGIVSDETAERFAVWGHV